MTIHKTGNIFRDLKKIMIISPFNAVARQFHDELRQDPWILITCQRCVASLLANHSLTHLLINSLTD